MRFSPSHPNLLPYLWEETPSIPPTHTFLRFLSSWSSLRIILSPHMALRDLHGLFVLAPVPVHPLPQKIKSRKNGSAPVRSAAIPWSSGCMMLEGIGRRWRMYWSLSQVGDVFLWPLALDPEYLDNVGSGLLESSLMTFMACQPRCLPKGNDILHGKSSLGTACWQTYAGHEDSWKLLTCRHSHRTHF